MTAPIPRFASDDEAAQHWLGLLRDGSDEQKIQAREQLAAIFEHRGMFEEATDLLVSNVRAGVRNADIFRWLARLYRAQGDEVTAMQAAAEAAKYMTLTAYPSEVAPTLVMPSPHPMRMLSPNGACETCGYVNRNVRMTCKRCRAPLLANQGIDGAGNVRTRAPALVGSTGVDAPQSVSFPTSRVRHVSLYSSRIAAWSIGVMLFIVFIAQIESFDERPGQLNPFRSVWYIFALASTYPVWQFMLELILPALMAWIIASGIGRRLAGEQQGDWQAWFALVLSCGIGLLIYVTIFAAGEALLEASFRARLPIWFWIVYYAYIGAYKLNVGLGLFVHILISSIFGLGAGRWIYEKCSPASAVL